MNREEFRARCYEDSGVYTIPENELDEIAEETGCTDEEGNYDPKKISVMFNCEVLLDLNSDAMFPGCEIKF